MQRITVIIVNWNTKKLIINCLDSLFRSQVENLFEVTVVDNGSTDGRVEAIKNNFSQVKIIENVNNEGFAKANNKALGKKIRVYASFEQRHRGQT